MGGSGRAMTAATTTVEEGAAERTGLAGGHCSHWDIGLRGLEAACWARAALVNSEVEVCLPGRSVAEFFQTCNGQL